MLANRLRYLMASHPPLRAVFLRPLPRPGAAAAPACPSLVPERSTTPARRKATAGAADLAARQSAGGRKGAASRMERSVAVIVGAAVRLAADGSHPTQAAVLAAVAGQNGASARTISRHWKMVMAAVAANCAVTDVSAAPVACPSPLVSSVPPPAPDLASAKPDPLPTSQSGPKEPLTPAEHCEILQHIFRDYLARGMSRALIASAHQLPLSVVVDFFGPDPVAEDA